jgi:hypothetical protein
MATRQLIVVRITAGQVAPAFPARQGERCGARHSWPMIEGLFGLFANFYQKSVKFVPKLGGASGTDGNPPFR